MSKELLRFQNNKEITLVDCETQNLCLNEIHNLPWQISWISFKGKETSEEKDRLIKWTPALKVSAEAARITRYNESRVQAQGINPEFVAKEIWDKLHNADYIMGHNILGFDYYILNSFFRKILGKEYNFTEKVIDTLALARGVQLEINKKSDESLLVYQYKLIHKIQRGLKTSLAFLAKHYGLDFDSSKLHDAMYDLKINKQIWEKMKWELEI